MDANSVLTFWREAGPKKWWSKDDAFDANIHTTFGDLYQQAIDRRLEDWRKFPHSCLALIILLDQFSRNLNRDSAKAFAHDPYCLEIATQAIDGKLDEAPEVSDLRNFFYLPLMHSETLAAQRSCIAKMNSCKDPLSLEAAIIHYDIIRRFGRFPHRNPVLGRHTTPAEQEFLDGGGFKG